MAATWSAPFILNNFVNFNPLYLKFGRMIKIHERLLPCKLGKNSSWRKVQNTSSWPSKFPHSFLWQNRPFISDDVHATLSDTTLTAELSPKFVPFIQFCPPRVVDLHDVKLFDDRAILPMQNRLSSSMILQLLEFLPWITFLLPVLNDPYLGILEEDSLEFLCTKLWWNRLEETKVMRKTNRANASFPIR